MTELEKAARMALEWGNNHGEVVFVGGGMNAVDSMNDWLSALRRALEQPAQDEPVEWLTGCPECGMDSCECGSGKFSPQALEQPAQQEPFGHVTVRRLSQRFENHADQFHFYPAGQSPYLDNVDELHTVYTRPQAREQPAQRCPLCNYQHGHAIGCKNNPVDIALARLV